MTSFTRFLPLVAALLLGVTGCSEETDNAQSRGDRSTSGARPNGRPDETHFDVKWKSSTVVIEESTTKKAWIESESSPDEGLYVFRDNADIAALEAGQVVVLPAIGLFEIEGVETDGAKITLTTKPASLMDAATEGDVSWDIDTTNHEIVALVREPSKASGTKTQSLRPLDNGLPAKGDSIDFQVKAEGYEFGLKMANHKDAERAGLSFEIVGGVEETSGGGASISAKSTLSGHMSFRSGGAFKWKEDKVLAFDFNLRDVDLDATGEFEVSGLTVRGELIDYEARIAVPFLLGGIPMYYAFGTAVNINADIGLESKIKMSGNIKYKGDVSFSMDGLKITNPKATGTPVITGSGSPEVTAEATIITNIAAPRIELGMGVPHLEKLGVEAGLYVDLRSNMGAMASVSGGGACFKTINAFQGYVGGEAKFFGLKVSKETPILSFSETTTERGSCPKED